MRFAMRHNSPTLTLVLVLVLTLSTLYATQGATLPQCEPEVEAIPSAVASEMTFLKDVVALENVFGGETGLLFLSDSAPVHVAVNNPSEGGWPTPTELRDVDGHVGDTGDIDGDGDIDVLLGTFSGVSWLPNEGLGFARFSLPIASQSGYKRGVALADMDGDNDLDAVFVTDVGVYWVNHTYGNGTFSPTALQISTGVHPITLLVADLNNDGLMDVFTPGGENNPVWFENTLPIDGSFILHSFAGPPEFFGTGSCDGGDLDGDGDVDLVYGIQGVITMFINTLGDVGATTTFEQVVIADTVPGIPYVTLADVDDDGDLDILAAISGPQLEFYRNLYDPGNPVSVAQLFSSDFVKVATLSSSPTAITVAPLASPGVMDIVVASRSDVVSVSISSSAPPPRIAFGDGEGTFPSTTVASLAVGAFSNAAVQIVDMDGDGSLDVLAYIGNELILYINTDGAGTFDSGTVIATTENYFVRVADVNGDGSLDLVGGRFSLQYVPNLDGKTTFGDPVVIEENVGMKQIMVDVDADGDLDFLCVWDTNRKLVWYSNLDGRGTFGPAIEIFPDVTSSCNPVFLDVDADGDNDILCKFGGLDAPGVKWFNNTDGTGTFASTPVEIGNLNPGSVNSGYDFNNDGYVDLYVPFSIGRISWYPNDGTGRVFGPQQLVGAAEDTTFSYQVTPMDVDSDGDIDFLVVDAATTTGLVKWYENNGNGVFSGIQTLLANLPSTIKQAFLVDIDSDGDLDLLWRADTAIAYSPQLTRGPFHDYSPKSRALVPYSRAAPTSFARVAASLGSLSRCATDTLVLPPGVYGCRAGSPFELTYGARIEGSAGVRFECDSGLLFRLSSTVGGVSIGTLEMNDVVISGMGSGSGTSTSAPGLRVDGERTKLVLRNVTMENGNSVALPSVLSSGVGGCLLAVDGGRVEMMDSEISGCSASVSGGGLAVVGPTSSASISNSRVTGNEAGGVGGGLLSLGGGVLEVAASVMSGNSAGTFGGGVGVEGPGGTVEVVDVAISSNTATMGGGGVWVSPTGGDTLVRACTVENNVASMGGGLAVCAADSNVATGTIVGIPKSADASGGAAAPSPALVLEDVSVQNNIATKWGGGLYACDTRVRVEGGDTSWSGNKADRSPGLGSSADVLVCPAGSGFTPNLEGGSSDGIPWLDVELPVWEGEANAWSVHGPLTALAWVEEPANEVEAGGAVSGRVRGLDWFGSVVVYEDVVIESKVGEAPVVVPIELAPTLLSAPVVSLPPVTLAVADTDAWPGEVVVTASVVVPDGESSSTLETGSVSATVRIGLCQAGREPVVENGRMTCLPSACPVNTLRVVANSTSDPCVCVKGTWVVSGEVNEACVACPTGGVCDGGLARPRAGPGFYPEQGGGVLFLACPNPNACLGNGGCQAGYTGRLCAQCADGFYALRGQCSKCNTGVNTLVTVLLVVAAVVVGIVLLVFNLAEGMRYKFAAAMVGLNALQISAIYGKLELDWGGFAAAYFDVVSSVNLNVELTSPECSLSPGTDAWVAKLVLTLLLPVFAGVVLGGVALVVWGLAVGGVGWFGSKNGAQVGSAFVRAWFQSLVLLYMALTSAALSVFGCRKDESGRWVLDADPVRSCYNGAWWSGLFPVGLVAVFVYAIAIPAGVVFVLHRKRQELDSLTFALRFGFLVGRFHDHVWWFETGIMGRKLAVVMCMTFFFTDEGKANGAVLVLVGSLIQLTMTRPYVAQFHNWLAMVVLAATSCVLYAGTFDDLTFRRVGVGGGIVINVLAIVVGNAVDVWRMTREESEAEEKEFFGEGLFRMDTVVELEDVPTSFTGLQQFESVGVAAYGSAESSSSSASSGSSGSSGSGELATVPFQSTEPGVIPSSVF